MAGRQDCEQAGSRRWGQDAAVMPDPSYIPRQPAVALLGSAQPWEVAQI